MMMMMMMINKADSITSQELMRVYGALFWNFAPLINVVEPPRVYVGSFWFHKFNPMSNNELFLKEEISLLHDLDEVITNSLENKIASIRQHANQVLIHAVIVDKYIEVFTRERTLFGDNEAKWVDIVKNPNDYNIFHSLLSLPYVSKYDLPPPERYQEFFRINLLSTFSPLSSHCQIFWGCPLDKIHDAMAHSLPRLLSRHQLSVNERTCSADRCRKH